MAQWVATLHDTGASVFERVVCATAGAAYVATSRGSPITGTVSEISDAGVEGWHTNIALPGGASLGSITIAANATAGVVAFACDAGSALCYVVALDAADGTVIWQVSLPFDISTYSGTFLSQKIAVDSSGNVVVVGKAASNTEHRLCKLAAADGAVSWTRNPLPTTVSSSQHATSLALMSTGNVVVAGQNTAGVAAIHVFAAADGAAVWARSITWPSGASRFHVATDPDDNVYASAITGGSTAEVDVVKLDDTGAEVWIRDVTIDGAGAIAATGGMAADADYVYIGSYVSTGSGLDSGLIAVGAAGSAANGLFYPMPDQAYTDGAEGLAAADGAVYFTTYNDPDTAAEYRAVVSRIEPPDFNPQTFGASEYERVSQAYTVASGSATTSSISPTYDTDSESSSTGTATIGADADLEFTLYASDEPTEALIRFASSLGPTAQFGSARWANAYPASSLGPTAAFGTPALDLNLEAYPVALGPTAGFGTPYAFTFTSPQPIHYASSLGRVTVFGTPAVLASGVYAQQETAVETAFGTPTARLVQAATSLAPAAVFGTATLRTVRLASGFRETAFGTPTFGSALSASGFSATVFGAPRAVVPSLALAASSLGPVTAFGTPAAFQAHLARSLGPTARLGTPYVVQACP